MKKLYESIEDIYIRGGADQLTQAVTAMDIALQNITEGTNQTTQLLMKYSESNKGQQFVKAISTMMSLRDVLNDASLELNGMQNDIVAYQNKIYRYEDMTEYASAPNPYMVNQSYIAGESLSMQFNRTEMITVSTELGNYSDAVFYHVRNLNDQKNSLANIWLDSQYDNFAEFIDSISYEIIEAVKIFDEYVLYLKDKIKELS